MEIRLLKSSFDDDGSASERQHTACFVVNGTVAFDAGSLAMAVGGDRDNIRDIVLSHTHLDHIAGLPLFVDDLFSTLRSPVRVYGTKAMIAALRTHIFNDIIYPNFEEIENEFGRVLEFREYEFGIEFSVGGLSILPVEVNHNEPSAGFVISGPSGSVALSGDTADTDGIWTAASAAGDLKAVLVECAFPDEMSKLAETARHLTPSGLKRELEKLERPEVPVFVVNIKPMFRPQVVAEIKALGLPGVSIFPVGEAVSV
ncbi:MAG: 3',5'-cyclic-nucleotide phosphodiesterase [Acidobacteria bacterium]|nr:3',5'-cyclic-nucleotide phosphodiesterase [Acidobacteriota bacterium]